MDDPLDLLRKCLICPRACGVNRHAGEKGFCRLGNEILIAHWGPHHGEEPPISGTHGSGTIFFSHCNLRCVFCQNYQISQGNLGDRYSIDDLVNIFFDLQVSGCHNINLVSPTPYAAHIAVAVMKARAAGLAIPVLYNTNGYDSVETLQMLDGLIDMYMPDFKYWSPVVAEKLSRVPRDKDYSHFVKNALLEMKRQVGDLFIENGIAQKGLLVRHLVLPGGLAGSREIFHWMAGHLGTSTCISLMSQYYPVHEAHKFKLLQRRLRSEEYDAVTDILVEEGFRNVFVQEMESAPLFVPDFEENEPFGGTDNEGDASNQS